MALNTITTILSVESCRRQIFKCQVLKHVLCSSIATACRFIYRKSVYHVASRLNFKSIEHLKKTSVFCQ